jgi:hypothetical protein
MAHPDNRPIRRQPCAIKLGHLVSLKLVHQLRDAGFLSKDDAHDKSRIAHAFMRAALVGMSTKANQAGA